MRNVSVLTAALGAVCLTTAPVSAQSFAAGSVPVQLEAMDGLDPCSFGQINDPAMDSSIIVFAGPSTDMDTVDFLSNGDKVWICQESDDFYGIVYAPAGSDVDCEVASPVDTTINYSGPCNTGWVKAEWVETLAG